MGPTQIINGAKGIAKIATGNTASEEIARTRYNICYDCPAIFFTLGKRRCKHCSCFVELKTKVYDEKCPIGKW